MNKRKIINPIHEPDIKSVLVTGGAGYVGCNLVRQLLDAGFNVRVLDAMWFGDQGLAEVKDRIEVIRADVRQFKDEYLDGIQGVVHLASLSNDPTAKFDPKLTKEINVDGLMRVAEACKRKDVRRFTFASSASVYGFNVDEICNEQSQLNPQSEYAQSKIDGEIGLMSLAESGGFFPVIFRQATIVGFSPRMRFDLVLNTMVRDAYLTGVINAVPCFRPLIDINDVCLPHVNAMNLPTYRLANFDMSPSSSTKYQVYNLVSKNYDIIELAFEVAKVLEAKVGLKAIVNVDKHSPDTRSYRISNHKALMGIGFVPRVKIEDAIMKLWNWISTSKIDLNDPMFYNLQVMAEIMKKGEL
jgi:nucleoside-diphosphate-sugar epimerase